MKEQLRKYIHDVRVFYNFLRVVCFIAGCVFLFLGIAGSYYLLFAFAAVLIFYVAVTIFCYVSFFQKAVLECFRDRDRIVLKTEKRTFTYDRNACRSFEERGGKFVLVFEDSTSCDSFYFYKTLPFGGGVRYFEEGELRALLDA